jgi:hypothetical protein
MLSPKFPIAGAAIVVALTAAPPAHAAGAVFGGTTNAYEPIVLTADRAAQKLKSAVITARASCDGGSHLPLSIRLTPAAGSPGFSPGADDFVVTRNAKGRFAGTLTGTRDLGEQTAKIAITLAGKLKANRAAGTLGFQATISDSQNAQVDACRTGSIRWSATRAPGRVYGGDSSQGEPVVMRLDAKRKKVSDLIIGWDAECKPDGFFHLGDDLTGFPLRAGRFGDAWEDSYDDGQGGKLKYAYTLTGTVARATAKGKLSVAVTKLDAAGATAWSCDAGSLAWKVATG